MDAWLARYALLLDALLADPSLPLDAPSLLLPGEAPRIAAWEAGRAVPPPTTLPAVVQLAAERWPDQPALCDAMFTVSYATLWSEAGRAAAALRARGVRRSDIIGWAFDRTAPMLVAVLGILRAGAAWLPIDPALPASRRMELCRRAGVRLVVGDLSAASLLAEDIQGSDRPRSRSRPTTLPM